MKLSKNFCWATFQVAAKYKVPSFYTDGFVYDIIYIEGDYMIANKRRLKTTVLNKVSTVSTDTQMYDILNTDDGYMLSKMKGKPNKENITTEEDKLLADLPDGTPLILENGQYKPLQKRGNK